MIWAFPWASPLNQVLLIFRSHRWYLHSFLHPPASLSILLSSKVTISHSVNRFLLFVCWKQQWFLTPWQRCFLSVLRFQSILSSGPWCLANGWAFHEGFTSFLLPDFYGLSSFPLQFCPWDADPSGFLSCSDTAENLLNTSSNSQLYSSPRAPSSPVLNSPPSAQPDPFPFLRPSSLALTSVSI